MASALLLAVALFITPTAAAAAAPTAPYTALFLDGNYLSWGVFDGPKTFTPSNGSTFTAQAVNGDGLSFRTDRGTDFWTLDLTPPTGGWTAGSTYELRGTATSTYAKLHLTQQGSTCPEWPGWVTVKEVVRDPHSNTLTGLAAEFAIQCQTGGKDLHGEVRWNSSLGYVGAAMSLNRHTFPNLPIGTSAAKTFTVTSTGSKPIIFGQASFKPVYGTADSFSLLTDTCSGTTLPYGETCYLTFQAAPVRAETETAFLELPDNTGYGKRPVVVQVTGTDPRTVDLSPWNFTWNTEYLGMEGEPQTVTVTANGSLPVTFGTAYMGGATPEAFVIASDGCSGKTIAVQESCQISIRPKPTATGSQTATLFIPDNSLTSPKTVQMSLWGYIGGHGLFHLTEPQRTLDTRFGVGAAKAPVGAGKVIHLKVTGRAGVPANGVGAVVLNVTVTGATASSFLTIYPTGTTRPTTSALNFTKGATIANSVTVAVSDDGKVDIYQHSGKTQIIADVVGYYGNGPDRWGPTGLGGQYHPVKPQRLLDTRTDWGVRLPAGYYANIPFSYGAGVDPSIRAVAVNITAVSPTGSGYLTAWTGSQWTRPDTSTLNFAKGSNVPNFAIVPVVNCADCGLATGLPSIGVYTSADTHLLVDIVGVIDDSTLPDGLRFTPRPPVRIADTRSGLGVPDALGPRATATITAPGSLATGPMKALALNVTAVAPTSGTYLTLWPDGIDGIGQPTVSNLNPAAGQTVPNAAITAIGPANAFNVYNHAGQANVLVDVVGTFYLYVGTASSPGGSGPAAAIAGRALSSIDVKVPGAVKVLG
ncbi:hypothetical protein F4553_004523 [Allocatelliglobosispora scoriae]|uniref:Choice-of-anchor D domain-containing protein n=1 Tax=Allocatelliglobosispora scoriae TaxID=643052 RepID=A0A841BSD9_9ACTN|nr:choice-of-anchor D domain-containing protein [Allocatelliglobosispora scoriae]MBB5871144.1 hypothetical protein [Allocatelliglobosispora scoriae]